MGRIRLHGADRRRARRRSHGEKDWTEPLRFWKPFTKEVQHIEKNVTREEVAESREIGKDPVSGKPIPCAWARTARSCSRARATTRQAAIRSLLPGQHMDDVTLADALKLLSLPRDLGHAQDGTPISVGRGQYGPYVKYGAKYASHQGGRPVRGRPRARDRDRRGEGPRRPRAHDPRFSGRGHPGAEGRYGPYVTDRKKNAKVPKDREPASLTLEECQALIAAAPERKGRFGRRAKAAAPAAAPAEGRAGQGAAGARRPRPQDPRPHRRNPVKPAKARNRSRRRRRRAAKKAAAQGSARGSVTRE